MSRFVLAYRDQKSYEDVLWLIGQEISVAFQNTQPELPTPPNKKVTLEKLFTGDLTFTHSLDQ